jgi:hypothetical protein
MTTAVCHKNVKAQSKYWLFPRHYAYADLSHCLSPLAPTREFAEEFRALIPRTRAPFHLPPPPHACGGEGRGEEVPFSIHVHGEGTDEGDEEQVRISIFVAQTSSRQAPGSGKVCGLEIRDTAGWKPALRPARVKSEMRTRNKEQPSGHCNRGATLLFCPPCQPGCWPTC